MVCARLPMPLLPHALDDAPADMADVGAISYADEDVAGRVGRREQRWTPVSKLPSSA
jgi:hypothetical protein